MSEIEDKNRLISLPEAAKLYGFHPEYLNQLARRGRLRAQKVGRTWVTTPANVEEYIDSRQRRGAYRDDIGPND
ncbi:MAG: helix-turn-helix domain-containing protein [Anaerolineales bacterium]|nr:helix-turn-helix domain-containing protein [Anaerolineales bacterium]